MNNYLVMYKDGSPKPHGGHVKTWIGWAGSADKAREQFVRLTGLAEEAIVSVEIES